MSPQHRRYATLAELVELLAPYSHLGYMAGKRATGTESRRSESGEEVMVPFEQLSEVSKDISRAAAAAMLDGLAALGVPVTALVKIMADDNDNPAIQFRRPCEHCPGGHTDPRRVPFGVYLGPQRDADGQPTQLIVMRTQGRHVAQSDADWLWQLIRDHARNTELPPELQQ